MKSDLQSIHGGKKPYDPETGVAIRAREITRLEKVLRQRDKQIAGGQRDLAAAHRETQDAIEDRRQISASLIQACEELAAAQATAQSEGKMRESLADDVLRVTERARVAEAERDAARAEVATLDAQAVKLFELLNSSRATARALRDALRAATAWLERIFTETDLGQKHAWREGCYEELARLRQPLAAATQEPAPFCQCSDCDAACSCSCHARIEDIGTEPAPDARDAQPLDVAPSDEQVMESFRCPSCGYLTDTPNHERGCKPYIGAAGLMQQPAPPSDARGSGES